MRRVEHKGMSHFWVVLGVGVVGRRLKVVCVLVFMVPHDMMAVIF